jgi:hypothetical protein
MGENTNFSTKKHDFSFFHESVSKKKVSLKPHFKFFHKFAEIATKGEPPVSKTMVANVKILQLEKL